MFSTFATIFAAVILCAAAVQLLVAIYFRRTFFRKEVCRLPSENQNSVAVLMCVRGCDPSLRHSLIGILNQEFDNYAVHLVVDHCGDMAWGVVQEIKREHDVNNILTIHEMQDPLDTCGLKCSALIQGLSNVAPETDYVVLMDADVRPHSTWLAEATGPLAADPTIGLVTGNQWFEPMAGSSWGSLVRSMWNAGALVPTAIFQNPWAGTLAMRMEDVRKAELSRVWRHSVVDDGPMRQVMDKLGLAVHFAPSLIMINRERCTFSYVTMWVTRMLTWSRLYESTFFLSVIHSVFSNSIMMATFGLSIAGLLMGNYWVAGSTMVALLVSGLMSVAAYLTVRSSVSRSCALRGETLQPIGLIRVTKLMLTVPIAQLIYGMSCLRSIFMQQVKWREITYELKGKTQVRMMNYQPIAQSADEIHSKVSI
jgi:hypothetical protein